MIGGGDLQPGDVFTTKRLHGWWACLAKPKVELADPFDQTSKFWEVSIVGVSENGRMTHEGGYVGVGMRQAVQLNMDLAEKVRGHLYGKLGPLYEGNDR